MKKVDILAIGVHPDDVELCASGTLLRHKDLGYTVGILDLTRGELGTRGNPELRMEEAKNAAAIIGAEFRENLRMADGFFQHTRESMVDIARVIRICRPQIVLINAVRDRHPDHGRASKLTSDACFIAGLVKVEIEHNGKVLDRWRPQGIYHYIQDYSLHPDVVVDITKYADKKIAAIQCFASQFYNPTSDEPDSPISRVDFMDFIQGRDRVNGRYIGVEFAEGFTVDRPVGVGDLTSLL